MYVGTYRPAYQTRISLDIHNPSRWTDPTNECTYNPPLYTRQRQIKPTAPTHLGALPALAFQQRFPPHSFFRVLSSFGAGQALGALLEGLPEVGALTVSS